MSVTACEQLIPAIEQAATEDFENAGFPNKSHLLVWVNNFGLGASKAIVATIAQQASSSKRYTYPTSVRSRVMVGGFVREGRSKPLPGFDLTFIEEAYRHGQKSAESILSIMAVNGSPPAFTIAAG